MNPSGSGFSFWSGLCESGPVRRRSLWSGRYNTTMPSVRQRIEDLESQVRFLDETPDVQDLFECMDALTLGRRPTYLPTPRWTRLRPHPEQTKLWNSTARFHVVPAGRRSGKTELAKRKLVKKAIGCTRQDGRYIAAAPTHGQAEQIYWKDLKRLTPPDLIVGTPSESRLRIELFNGASIQVMGMDVPERCEGSPIDFMVLDEYANMIRRAWTDHVRPGLDTPGRPGEAWLIGVPEGRDHYFDLWTRANSGDSEWAGFTWESASVLDKSAIEQAMKDMDARTFDREMRGSFVDFAGRAYFAFGKWNMEPVEYRPELPLDICLDFNVSPGVCAIAQEQTILSRRMDVAPKVSAYVDEIWIPDDSTVFAICRRIIEKYGSHRGLVRLFGDATGGARSYVSERGSAWDIVRKELGSVFMSVQNFVPSHNPSEVARIGAVNSRLRATSGLVSLLVNPTRCPHLVKDLEGVLLLEGGSGEVDKKRTPELTHISDALGYREAKLHPVRKETTIIEQF